MWLMAEILLKLNAKKALRKTWLSVRFPEVSGGDDSLTILLETCLKIFLEKDGQMALIRRQEDRVSFPLHYRLCCLILAA